MTLRISNLNFSYTDKLILSAVNTGVLPSGKITALLGPNAAGKSTFFRCISGVLKPQQGGVWLGQQDLTQQTKAQQMQQVCYMPQNSQSSAALTVFEVVLLAYKHLRNWRVSDEDTLAVAEILKRFAIDHIAQCYIGELSGGQQQIVALCQAMVRRARIFLLDEPTSALDLQHQLSVMHTLQSLAADYNAVMLISLHDLNLAARFADHIILMNNGNIVASGKTENILSSQILADTYGVKIELQRSTDGTCIVAASL